MSNSPRSHPSVSQKEARKELVRDATPDSLRRAAEVLRDAIEDAGESQNVPLYRGFAKLLAAQLEILAAQSASLPAVPANLGFLITMLKEKAISLFLARDRRAESEKEEAEYLKARSHLENLFLEQQREIERLRASRSPTASPDQDFLKLLDEWQQSVEEASRILRANHVSLPARDEILRVRTERRQSLVDYLEGIRAERDAARTAWRSWQEAAEDYAEEILRSDREAFTRQAVPSANLPASLPLQRELAEIAAVFGQDRSDSSRERLLSACRRVEDLFAALSALKEDALTKEEATEIIDWLPVDATYLDSHPVIESARTKIFRVALRISSSGGNKE